MYAHHERVIQRLVELFKDDPRYPAMIVGGSVAKGRAGEHSDIDILLLATDEEYARREPTQDFWYLNREICDYAGGYVEGKVIDMRFLLDAADHGSEPARAAFVGAFLAYSRIPALRQVLERIPVFQEQERQEKIGRFYSQVLLLNWLVREAEKRNDEYLMMHATSELVLFGGRLLLAYNRVLYPYHKWFMYELKRAEKKSADFMELIEKLLKQPCKEHAQAFCDSLSNFQDWGVTYAQAVVKFMEDNEWTWRTGRPALQDW
jgi:predicted nucleotidyltransferase